MPDVTIRYENGVALATGGGLRPRDPAEDKYALSRTLPPRAVDLNVTRVIDNPLPVLYQGAIGSCAAFSSEVAARLALTNHTRGVVEPLHMGWLYHWARAKHGWQDQDTGSYTSDNLDLLCNGAPALAVSAYVDNISWRPSAQLDAAPRFDYVLSHRPFYAGPDFHTELAMALDAGMPVVLTMAWLDQFFSPRQGVLPRNLRPPANPFYHAVVVFGRTRDGYLLTQNSWSTAWAPDAAGNHVYPALRAGQFLIPPEYATNGVIVEARAVSVEPVPVPEPQPEPEPTPGPRPEPADRDIYLRDRALSILDDEINDTPSQTGKRALRSGRQRVSDWLLEA